MFKLRRVVDLTLLIDEQLPATWPGHMPFMRRTWNWYEAMTCGPEVNGSINGPYFTEALVMDEHIGTHFDAPAHVVPERGPGQPNAMTGDLIDPAVFCGEAIVIDATGLHGTRGGVSPLIEAAAILDVEARLGRQLTADDVVLFRSDWDVRFYKTGPAGSAYAQDVLVGGTAPGWPAPSVEAVELLIKRGVRCAGTDAPSMGPSEGGAPVHVAGLGAGMVFIEGLANLAALPVSGGHFQFLPLKIARSSGGPGRAIAWLRA